MSHVLLSEFWNGFHFQQFGFVFYAFVMIGVFIGTLALLTKLYQEGLEPVEYLWITVSAIIIMFVIGSTGYLILMKYAVEYDEILMVMIVTSVFDEGLTSIAWYFGTVLSVMIGQILAYRFALRDYIQLPQTKWKMAIILGLVTAPWIFLFFQ
jgi:hypothetical protein